MVQQHLLGKIRAYASENIEVNSGTTHTVKSLIYKHFEHLSLYKNAEFAAIQSCSHLPDKLSFPLQLSNLIWELAGDTSTDMNYYSKRLILAGIYTATLLYWYKNNSPLSDVMAFFDQRLKNHIILANKGKYAKNSLRGIKKNILFLRDYFSTN